MSLSIEIDIIEKIILFNSMILIIKNSLRDVFFGEKFINITL